MSGDDASPDLVRYATWGELFFDRAVTIDRVLAGVGALSGRPVTVGPLAAGPRRLAKVTAHGDIGVPRGRRSGDEPARFDVLLPITLELVIDLGVDTHRFHASLEAPLRLTAHARRDLAIVIDVRPPHPHELRVQLRALSRRAAFVQHAAGVEAELRRHVARHIAREVDDPRVRAACTIDVAGAIDGAIDRSDDMPADGAAPDGGATQGPPPPGTVTGGPAVAAQPLP